MTLSPQNAQQLQGATITDQSGSKIGKVADIYLDRDTRQPEWALVQTGLFGGRESFVPLAEATLSGDTVQVPYGKDQVKGAPNAEPDGDLSQDEEARLYAHYGLNYTESASDSGLPTGGVDRTAGTVGRDTSGPTTDDAMTLSEERLRVGVVKRPSQTVRLRKTIHTEQVSQTVPVMKERAVLTREPITEANRGAATSGQDLTTEEHEVVLAEDRVVVDKNVVPVERVRLDRDTVTEQVQVSEQVRKERIELDEDRADTRR